MGETKGNEHHESEAMIENVGGTMKGFSMTICMWNLRRRKDSSLLLFALMALICGVCLVLNQLIVRQQAALQQTVEHTKILCTVTDAAGKSSDIQVMPSYLDVLTGKREAGVEQYVSDIRCVSNGNLHQPYGVTLCRVYGLFSDPLLEYGGVEVIFWEDWTAEDFRGNQLIAVISEGLTSQVEERDGTSYIEIQTEDGHTATLRVAGVVSGLPSEIVYCPIYAPLESGTSAIYLMDSCSFSIRDNEKLEEAKERLFQVFAPPKLSAPGDGGVAGLIVQDTEYQSALEEIRANLQMLQILLPALLILTTAITFFVNYLIHSRRRKEFAIMRCLGQKTWEIFWQNTIQQGGLILLGSIASLLTVSATGGVFGNTLLVWGGTVLMAWLGIGGCIYKICRESPIALMKVEE